MRNTIIRFPTVRPDADLVRRDPYRQPACRWLRNPETGQLERRWSLSAVMADTRPAGDSTDAAA